MNDLENSGSTVAQQLITVEQHSPCSRKRSNGATAPKYRTGWEEQQTWHQVPARTSSRFLACALCRCLAQLPFTVAKNRYQVLLNLRSCVLDALHELTLRDGELGVGLLSQGPINMNKNIPMIFGYMPRGPDVAISLCIVCNAKQDLPYFCMCQKYIGYCTVQLGHGPQDACQPRRKEA